MRIDFHTAALPVHLFRSPVLEFTTIVEEFRPQHLIVHAFAASDDHAFLGRGSL